MHISKHEYLLKGAQCLITCEQLVEQAILKDPLTIMQVESLNFVALIVSSTLHTQFKISKKLITKTSTLLI